MAKKVQQVLKLNLPAGAATPAPPIGPILGQAGINMMEFLKQYNDETKDKRGQVIPADLIKQQLKLQKGSSDPKKDIVGELTIDQVKAIAEKKLPDLNTTNLENAINTVSGTARSMGVKVKE